MDQIKTGKFIAELRRKEGMTQQQLGEYLGVTNKTVSRWENGNYMPDIEMLQLLSQLFHVSINELIAGQHLENEEFRRQADENLVSVAQQSSFSYHERKEFWIRKWRKDHVGMFVMLIVLDLLLILLLHKLDLTAYTAFLPLLVVIQYGWQHNRMMIDVENHLYGDLPSR